MLIWSSYYVPATVLVILRATCHAGTFYSYFTYMETKMQRKCHDQGLRTVSGTGLSALFHMTL